MSMGAKLQVLDIMFKYSRHLYIRGDLLGVYTREKLSHVEK